ncbi:hypothetical protein [Microcystis phage MaeS]|nr:hypothetical protein [Microcystis phage MaeS]
MSNYEKPLCPECKVRKCYRKAWRKDGITPIFHSKCDYCRGKKYARMNSKRRKYLKAAHNKLQEGKCQNCGFVVVHTCQLDVDHIDGNHNNNHPDNLQVLCANCHRLKTFLNGDYLNETNRK